MFETGRRIETTKGEEIITPEMIDAGMREYSQR